MHTAYEQVVIGTIILHSLQFQ